MSQENFFFIICPELKCSLRSLKILSLTFNYQLISWCPGVWQILSAICLVDLRYSAPKSAEKWPVPQQNNIQKKFKDIDGNFFWILFCWGTGHFSANFGAEYLKSTEQMAERICHTPYSRASANLLGPPRTIPYGHWEHLSWSKGAPFSPLIK